MESTKSKSFKTFSSEFILDMCNYTIDRINEIRIDKDAKYIEKHREALDSAFLNYIWSKKIYTTKEAKLDIENSLKAGGLFSDHLWRYPCVDYFSNENKAYELKRLCLTNVDAPVNITCEDFNLIWKRPETKHNS